MYYFDFVSPPIIFTATTVTTLSGLLSLVSGIPGLSLTLLSGITLTSSTVMISKPVSISCLVLMNLPYLAILLCAYWSLSYLTARLQKPTSFSGPEHKQIGVQPSIPPEELSTFTLIMTCGCSFISRFFSSLLLYGRSFFHVSYLYGLYTVRCLLNLLLAPISWPKKLYDLLSPLARLGCRDLLRIILTRILQLTERALHSLANSSRDQSD